VDGHPLKQGVWGFFGVSDDGRYIAFVDADRNLYLTGPIPSP
jgi:hypothetical protein